MKNKNGFTLIELLAVITILGIVMIIAVPSISSYIASSRKSTYIESAKGYIESVKRMVTSRELSLKRKNITYYIPYQCIPVEKGGFESPYGDWASAYVVVTYKNNMYDYYWVSYDSSNTGMKLTHESLLDESRVKEDIDYANTNVGVLNAGETASTTERDRIVILNAEEVSINEYDKEIKCVIPKDESGNIKDKAATTYIPYHGEA